MEIAGRLERLARAAAAEVRDGMRLGLGHGTTASAVVRELGRRVGDGLQIEAVPASEETERLARDLSIPLRTLDQVDRLDLGIDGADEIAPNLDAIKGGGGALLVEKLVALACDDYLLVAAGEKRSPALGTRFALPVEVVPTGWTQTARRLTTLGLRPRLREAAPGAPFFTEGGHLILDCAFDPVADAAPLAEAVKLVVGVVEHGLFVGIARRALLVAPGGEVVMERRPPRRPAGS